MLTESFDTIVIGAGAAGLGAAITLAQKTSGTVCMLEARDRVGGRVLTLQDDDAAGVLELGAEFIHGESPATLSHLRMAGREIMDAPQTRWMIRNSELKPADVVFERMKQRLRRLRVPKRDLAFGEFLQRHQRELGASVSLLACMLVTGFDAADLDRVSTRDILKEWSGSSAADAPTFRPVGGYGALMQHLVAGLRSPRCELRLGHAVTEVRWRRAKVDIAVSTHTGPARFQARRVIVTVPLSVLQGLSSAAIHFDPVLSRKRNALAAMAMGPVIKLLLQFREPFWESLQQGRYRNAAFFLAPGAAFPTCWTSLPIRNARLVAWAAGPAAARLHGMNAEAMLDAALSSLRSVFGRQVPLRRLLRSFHWHDWQADPFSAGAYSYVRVGGESAHAALARPILDTLYFAGEACGAEESASVGGALQSGIDAANRIASRDG